MNNSTLFVGFFASIFVILLSAFFGYRVFFADPNGINNGSDSTNSDVAEDALNKVIPAINPTAVVDKSKDLLMVSLMQELQRSFETYSSDKGDYPWKFIGISPNKVGETGQEVFDQDWLVDSENGLASGDLRPSTAEKPEFKKLIVWIENDEPLICFKPSEGTSLPLTRNGLGVKDTNNPVYHCNR